MEIDNTVGAEPATVEEAPNWEHEMHKQAKIQFLRERREVWREALVASLRCHNCSGESARACAAKCAAEFEQLYAGDFDL